MSHVNNWGRSVQVMEYKRVQRPWGREVVAGREQVGKVLWSLEGPCKESGFS